jgi:hypothetical protein
LLACERVRAHLPELEYEDIRRLHAAVSAAGFGFFCLKALSFSDAAA